MPRRGGPDPDARRRAEESEAALAAGGIPLAASERLEAFRASGERFFTSDLSVNELVVTRDAGFRPLTQVMGTCFYRTGWQSYPWATGGGWLGGGGWGVSAPAKRSKLEQQTDAWNEARRLAVGRLAEETRRAGGDTVVGVHLRRRHHDWAAGLIEFVVIGTAVRSERARLETDEPALSNLSGQDLSKLVRHGFRPVGLVAATTVAYVATGGQQQMRSTGLFSSWQNQEMPDFTRGIYDARALAMTRAQPAGPRPRRARRRRRDDRALAPRDRARPRRRHEVHRPHHRDARPRHRHRRGAARRGAAARLHGPAAQRPGANVTNEPEQYDPTSTAGIPEHGIERLAEMREHNFFTSDLSVNEFLLVKEAGFQPLGLVMG